MASAAALVAVMTDSYNGLSIWEGLHELVRAYWHDKSVPFSL